MWEVVTRNHAEGVEDVSEPMSYLAASNLYDQKSTKINAVVTDKHGVESYKYPHTRISIRKAA